MSGPNAAAILLVDDDAGKRLALKSVLAPLGYTVVEAESGVTALRCLMERDFAVILLDVCMPGMDGFETAAFIRQRERSEMTPIIFITAFQPDEISKTDRFAEGAVDFIYAPVPPEELRAKVSVFTTLFTRAEALATQTRDVQASADQLRLLTDAAPIGIFRTDVEKRYVYTNPHWTEITGMAAEDADGRAWDDALGAVGADEHAEDGHRFQILHPDGTTRILHVTLKPIPDRGGGEAGWVGILADVTAEAGAEVAMAEARDQANAASALKSDFLANMSHEIRTPMNGVIGMTDLLLETDLSTRQRDYAQTVRNSGEALLTIIDDILDFSKIEVGKLNVEDVEFDLRVVVEDVVALLAGPAQTKGLEVVSIVDRAVPSVVSGDPGRVRQVLTNLIGNAIKFTQVGEVVVRVTEALAEDGETLIRFEVTDTGDGIAPDKLAKVFQPFVQADTSTSRKYGGTGLGLAISSQLVSLMGGDCGVDSVLGQGSAFWFTVHVGSTAGQATHPWSATDPELSGVRVLVVDDNATQRTVLTEFLSDWGLEVTTAASGAEALALLAEQRFAVALLDHSLPEMDGVTLSDAIAADPALDTRPVLMTCKGEDADLDGRVVVPKPIRRRDLLVNLRAALGVTADCEPAQRPSAVGARGKGRVLLAEDNPINRKVAVAMLCDAGFRVDTVVNGVEAVAAAIELPYDAILMDCQMPEMNGYEATAAIRAQEGSDRHTPIIAVTAGARVQDRERCLQAGMDSYLAKPVGKEALLALVTRAMRNGLGQPDAVLDMEVIAELRLLGDTASFVTQFVSEAEPLLTGMRDALERGEAPVVGQLAHQLRGGSSQLGGKRLATSCERLHARAAQGSLTGGAAELDEIETDYRQLCEALLDV